MAASSTAAFVSSNGDLAPDPSDGYPSPDHEHDEVPIPRHSITPETSFQCQVIRLENFKWSYQCNVCKESLGKWGVIKKLQHHCRLCGNTVCDGCSGTDVLIEGRPERTCDLCVKKTNKLSSHFAGMKTSIIDSYKAVGADEPCLPLPGQEHLDVTGACESVNAALERLSPLISEAILGKAESFEEMNRLRKECESSKAQQATQLSELKTLRKTKDSMQKRTEAQEAQLNVLQNELRWAQGESSRSLVKAASTARETELKAQLERARSESAAEFSEELMAARERAAAAEAEAVELRAELAREREARNINGPWCGSFDKRQLEAAR